MAKNLVIVESPAKAKTISQFLGKEFTVLASMGHIRDLPKSKMGIDIEHGFAPSYVVSKDKKGILDDIQKKVKPDTILWIATDEDREGEAIGFHLTEVLNIKSTTSPSNVRRIVFHEVTQDALKAAIENHRQFDVFLIHAQQARRILDRLVGYELSPLLWKKIRYGLSAGRVQSVAVRLIVDREREIRAFKAEEYWSLTAMLQKQEHVFEAKCAMELKKKEDADRVLFDLEGRQYAVSAVHTKEVKRTPAPPFTTSTLQQEAARKLGFSVKKTMMLAQRLYEGVDLPEGTTGVITYMRTDSVNLAKTALEKANIVIREVFGNEFLLEKPRFYHSKKGAQEAHEAIRPTDPARKPEFLKQYLGRDEYRLYDLIWKRMIACQMKEATLQQVAADIEARKDGVSALPFHATGQSIVFAGFMRAYVEGSDNPEEELERREKFLPELAKGDVLSLQELLPQQHFTKPPARYTEASLVKKLEAEEIGRPSTYAPTISTIQQRGYIKKDGKTLIPTDVGEVVTDLLVEHFPAIVDVHFTARMEDDLDQIAEGKKEWVPVIREFYTPFHELIVTKQEELKKSDITTEGTSETCEQCGKPMVIKLGRYGKFLSCSDYPTCKNARPLNGKTEEAQQNAEQKTCEKCGKPMALKHSRYGAFYGCTGYPKCKNIVSLAKEVGVQCPKCGASLVERRAKKRGKLFFGCKAYPKCTFALWDRPTGEKCPKCQSLMVQKKAGVVCSSC